MQKMDIITNNGTNQTDDDNFDDDIFLDINCDDILPANYSTRNPTFSTIVFTMYGTIFIIALLGNMCVCYIVMHSPRMRTVTNYFIMNLSMGDILMTLFCVPFTSVPIMLQFWPFGAIMCTLVNYIGTLSVFISAYTMVAISIDKWMLIIYPLKPRISKRSATYIICLVWTGAGITVLPAGIFSEIQQPENDTIYRKCDKYICREDYSSVGNFYDAYTTILMILQYIIPLIVLIFTYTSIAAIIWCHRIPGEAENTRDKRMARSKRKMIKMMITVVLVFTMCWLPYNLYMIFQELISNDIKPYMFISFHLLAMSHACYNPIIYFYMNTRFRDGLLLILRTLPCFSRCYLRKAHGSLSSGFQHHAGLEGTDSTSLHRNNTFTTYITLNRKNRMSSSYQNNAQKASLVRGIQTANGNSSNNSRKKKNNNNRNNIADQPI